MVAGCETFTASGRPPDRQVTSGEHDLLPRFIQLGCLRLDLFHRDAKIAKQWARLHPREFEVLWRLAETPGQTLSRRKLLADVWRLDYDGESNRVEVNISRIRSKLHVFKLAWMIETNPEGGYRLITETYPSTGP